MKTYLDVPKWSGIENIREAGDCGIVECANVLNFWNALRGQPGTVSAAEDLANYHKANGWRKCDPSTDRGIILETFIQDWCRQGWFGDPYLTPRGYEPVTDRVAGLKRFGVLAASVALTETESFGDDALVLPPKSGHGVCMVAPLIIVTWTKLQGYSEAWWAKFGRQMFGLIPPAGMLPPGSIEVA
jgi:hypothetical protein